MVGESEERRRLGRMAEEGKEERRTRAGKDRQRDKRKEIKKRAKEEGCVEDICIFLCLFPSL